MLKVTSELKEITLIKLRTYFKVAGNCKLKKRKCFFFKTEYAFLTYSVHCVLCDSLTQALKKILIALIFHYTVFTLFPVN